ncbi:hypothetical protein [Streptomyces sp. NPDC059076]|uniref:hypothetical protein n=1 Tax=unclassified Streptomyces TaxID=2593676 RepID=UPI0036B8577E
MEISPDTDSVESKPHLPWMDLEGLLEDHTPERAEIEPVSLDQMRDQLLEAMSGVSEERWAAGWISGLGALLHREGGIWEVIGRVTGWPTGCYDIRTWVTWDEAAALYAHHSGTDQ